MYGKDHTEENKRLISKRNKGRIRSEETRRQISETMKGRPSPLKGKVGCFKNRAKHIPGLKRKPPSPETIEKIRNATKGIPRPRKKHQG